MSQESVIMSGVSKVTKVEIYESNKTVWVIIRGESNKRQYEYHRKQHECNKRQYEYAVAKGTGPYL